MPQTASLQFWWWCLLNCGGEWLFLVISLSISKGKLHLLRKFMLCIFRYLSKLISTIENDIDLITSLKLRSKITLSPSSIHFEWNERKKLIFSPCNGYRNDVCCLLRQKHFQRWDFGVIYFVAINWLIFLIWDPSNFSLSHATNGMNLYWKATFVSAINCNNDRAKRQKNAEKNCWNIIFYRIWVSVRTSVSAWKMSKN